MGLTLLLLCGLPANAAEPRAEREQEAVRLTLPPAIYAVAGVEMAVYYDNIVLSETPEAWRFQIECALGTAEARRWAATPTEEDIGQYGFGVKVTDVEGRLLAERRTALIVSAPPTKTAAPIRLLVLGDSLTGAGLYPAEIARLFARPGGATLSMLGTRRAGDGAWHEGYGGWTWRMFATHYEPAPDPANRKWCSPFVFAGQDGKHVLDVARYFKESCAGETPDVITILLGINDCFSAKPEAPDGRIDAMFAQADILLAAIRKAAPGADIGMGLTPAPNSRESGFEASYKGQHHRWEWKRVQHRLVERQLDRFGGREKDRLFLVPTELNLDPVAGYPVNNGVHPNAAGYRQIGASFYAWLAWRLGERK